MQTSSMFPAGAPTSPYGMSPRLVNTPAPSAVPADTSGPFMPRPMAMPPQLPPAQGPYPAGAATLGPQPSSIKNRLQLLVPALVAAFGPRIGAGGTAALLTGLMHGRDVKLAQQEHAEDAQRRRAFEAAEFRKNAVHELLQSQNVEELQAKLSGLQGLADHYGVDLVSGMQQAAGVVQARQDDTATKKQQAHAMEIVKHNDQTNPGQWSAPDDMGRMRPRAWWAERAGAVGLLPGKAKEPDKVTFGAPVTRLVNGKRMDVQRGSDGAWYSMDGQKVPAASVLPEPEKATGESGFTLGEGQVRYGADGKVIARGPAKASGREGAASPYATRSQSRLLTAIADLEPQISPDTVGTWRARGYRAEPFMPGESDPTVDFDAALTQITALIGFDELNQMRQASPTGGALGQVSERELTYLQSVAGSLDPNQSEPAFRRQLQKVKDEIARVVHQGLDGHPAQGGNGVGGRASGAGPVGGASKPDPLGIR